MNYTIKNIICRIAVPLFFVSSAYFVRKGSVHNMHYVNRYLKKTISSYLLWSLIFIPIGLDWIHQNLAVAGELLPFALLYGLIHIGTYYHLWYIPALIFSVFVMNKLVKRFSYTTVCCISLLLFLFGCIETYYGFLPAGMFKDFFDIIIRVIFTTRSGLFYGLIFVCMGFFIYDYQEKLTAIITYISVLTLLSAIGLVIEGFLLYDVTRLDMNFLLGLLPFSFCFFLWILSFSYIPKTDTSRYRTLSKYYYFVHPVCIVIIEQLGVAFQIQMLSSGIVSFILIILLTHLLSTCIISIHKSITYAQMFRSALCGLLITFAISSVIFLLKDVDIVVNFELVPCIWFISSFMMCYQLSIRKKAQLV